MTKTHSLRTVRRIFAGIVAVSLSVAAFGAVNTAGKLVEKDKGSLVENFTRVQTFGSGFNHWVELIIDPRAENLWTFKVHIIKENLDVHTVPSN
ncbi:MAG: hypothetical protein RIR75_553 [Actinomycetota bacterium]|jgi:peptidoglycan/LPS O-acetylase OafA/YrhL